MSFSSEGSAKSFSSVSESEASSDSGSSISDSSLSDSSLSDSSLSDSSLSDSSDTSDASDTSGASDTSDTSDASDGSGGSESLCDWAVTDVVPDDLGGVFNLANYGSDTIVLQSVVVAFMPPGISQVNISPDPPVVVFPEGDFRSIFVDCFDADSNLVTAVGVQLTLTVQCDSGPTSTVTITF